ncbi:hypothetical protein LRS74_19725 [Streptomyces sp. LX-29]|uniref:DUF6716 putative glycosyltransferase n=1 Tax=Streptomyces sp. LX-29 TaxID=2900152 RepID=UPI00240E44C5|nr:DUF6716 putative glycosyltransferase [Streptomyces sp. LX-29]WFB09024.1 hypothetical protein LRS74_19725 [Streptomyces sp. LX-29]
MPTRTHSTSAPTALRAAVLADSDTRWKWGALTARRLVSTDQSDNPQDIRLDGFLLRGRATPTVRQLREVGVPADALREVTGAEFVRAVDRELYDVIVLSCVGGGVQAMLHGLSRAWATPAGSAGGRRPVVVTGYVGVVYEKLADGLLLRHGADVVLANSRYDADRFREVYRGVGAAADSVVECALPFLGGARYDAEARKGRRHPGGTVVFAVQPSVPDNREDRGYLLRRALEHARKHPDREVLVKLRSKPGEHTTHIEELPYQKLAARIDGGVPANFRLAYGNMGEVLDTADLLVTVSSTAALESLHRGVPTAVLTDLGVREALGNHHFLGSGCLASWDQLDQGHLPEPDPEWLARQGVCADGSYITAFDAARARVAELAAAPALPPLTPYYSRTTAPGYLPRILDRYGFRPDGTPRPGAPGADTAEAGALRRVVRSTVREAARGAYRHGVQRVAPVIRRMGEL